MIFPSSESVSTVQLSRVTSRLGARGAPGASGGKRQRSYNVGPAPLPPTKIYQALDVSSAEDEKLCSSLNITAFVPLSWKCGFLSSRCLLDALKNVPIAVSMQTSQICLSPSAPTLRGLKHLPQASSA